MLEAFHGKIEKSFSQRSVSMTRPERRRQKKKYEKDFAAFCKITKQYFPEFIQWLQELKDPRKFWTYEVEVTLMTVIMKNICNKIGRASCRERV